MPCSTGPCGTPPVNTAATELLPSQIENFIKHFFGSVVKTEVNGIVSWVLPCNLDVGLENNPRDEGEGLACYFLRLFNQGIVGLTGPQGETGAAGSNGRNAYTITVLSFTQPTLGSPNLTVKTFYNPAILEETNVFIQGSGWYNVDAADANGFLYLTLTKAVSGATGTITAGKLVVPSGYPGESITGPQGPVGPQGPAGSEGVAPTGTNGNYIANVGTDYPLQVTSTPINFVNSSPQLLLPEIGTYLVTVIAAVQGQTGVATSDVVALKLYNNSTAADVSGTEQKISNLIDTQDAQVVINALVTVIGANQTISLRGECSSADKVNVIALRTTMTYVRIA